MTPTLKICLVSLLAAGVSTTSAFQVQPNLGTGTSRSTTSLNMFDWFNPKPKKTEDNKKQSNDFLGNFFNQQTPASAGVEEKKEEEAVAVAPEVPKEELIEEPIVAETKVKEEPVKVEEPAAVVEEEAAAAVVPEIHTGSVKWYNPRKGFGFIDSSAGEIFVHQSQIVCPGFRCLVDGEKVEYQIQVDEQGRNKATHVTGPQGGPVTMTLRRQAKAAEAEE